MNKMEEIIAASKLGELLQKKQADEKKKNTIVCVLAAVGVVLAVGLAAVSYTHLTLPTKRIV